MHGFIRDQAEPAPAGFARPREGDVSLGAEEPSPCGRMLVAPALCQAVPRVEPATAWCPL